MRTQMATKLRMKDIAVKGGRATVWEWDTLSGTFEPGSVHQGAWTGADGRPDIVVELPSRHREYLPFGDYKLTQDINGSTLTPDHLKFTLRDGELTEL